MADHYLQKAMDFIDNNIMKDINLYDISCEAGFSVPHFYRLFKRLTGDTVGAYILRRRVALAARDMIDSNKSISRIAYDYGFESHDVFTRAFIRIYGMSPKMYRRSGGSPPLKRLTILEDEQGIENQQMKFSVLQSNGFHVAGMECKAKIWDDDGSIGRLWSDFLTRTDEIKQALSPMIMYGICEHENCDGDHFIYMAAVGVNSEAEVPPGMTIRFIRAQSYFQANVPDSISTPDAYSGTIGYAKSLGYEIEDYDNIEVYEEVFRDPAIHSFNLLIPIKE